jgi:predicted dehydrogenase
MSRRLRVGILGCGVLGTRHATNLSTLPEVVIVACCDADEQRAQVLAEKVTSGQATVFTDYQDLLDRAALDALYICLPPFAHGDEVEQAAARGIHVFVEKPIALTSAHAWRMVQAVEAAGVKSQVGFMFRFGPAIEHLKTVIEHGQAGQVGMLVTRWYDSDLRQHPLWMHDRTKSGGLLLEGVIHHVDLHRYLLGEIVQVYAQIRQTRLHAGRSDYNLEDVAAIVLECDNGAIGVITTGDCPTPSPGPQTGELLAERLSASLQIPAQATIWQAGASEPLVVGTPGAWRQVYLSETIDFVTSILEDRPTRTPLREGARAQTVVEAAYRSAQEGRPVQPELED